MVVKVTTQPWSKFAANNVSSRPYTSPKPLSHSCISVNESLLIVWQADLILRRNRYSALRDNQDDVFRSKPWPAFPTYFFQRGYLLVGKNYIFLSHFASNTSNSSRNVSDCAIVRCCELLLEKVQSPFYGSFETSSWSKASCPIAIDRPTGSMDASTRCFGQGMSRLISSNAISPFCPHNSVKPRNVFRKYNSAMARQLGKKPQFEHSEDLFEPSKMSAFECAACRSGQRRRVFSNRRERSSI